MCGSVSEERGWLASNRAATAGLRWHLHFLIAPQSFLSTGAWLQNHPVCPFDYGRCWGSLEKSSLAVDIHQPGWDILIFKQSIWLTEVGCVWLYVTPWTVAHQAPLSLGFPRQDYWREWMANLFSRGSFRPRDGTRVSCIADGFFLFYFLFLFY